MFRIARNLLLICAFLAVVVGPACAVKKASNTYVLRIAAFTATPKNPKLARSKDPFASIVKQAPLFPETGASFALDISTPMRLRKQIESISNAYDFALTASGSVTCESGAVCPIDIAPSPDDLLKAQLKGECSLTALDRNLVKLDLKELTLYLLLPGQSKVLPVQTAKVAPTVMLNRTYMIGGVTKQQDGKTSLWAYAVCVVPAG